jgi:hypothetical protein
MKPFRELVTALALLSASSVTLAADAPLPELNLVYAVQYAGINAGEADIRLKADGVAGCYRYTTTTRPSGFVRALFGAPSQASRFCVADGVVRSQQFESVLDDDAEQSYRLDFDYAKSTVTDENGRVRTIPAEAVDSFSIQQAVRLWVAQHAKDSEPPVARFTMVDRKNLTYYQLRIVGRETVKTPAGRFETILLERIDNPGKVGRYWLAESRDWMPVKIETRSGKKPSLVMALKR